MPAKAPHVIFDLEIMITLFEPFDYKILNIKRLRFKEMILTVGAALQGCKNERRQTQMRSYSIQVKICTKPQKYQGQFLKNYI